MRAILVLGVFVAGIVIGAVAACLLPDSEPAQVPPPEVGVDQHAATLALADLRRAIDQLPAALRDELRREGSNAEHRRPAESGESDVDRLARAVEQLRAQLSKVPAGAAVGQGRDAADPWKGAGFESLAAMGAKVLGVRERDPEWKQRTLSEMTAAHALWSREDVIGRYGPPTRVTAEFGLSLHYSEPSFQMDEDQHCGFVFITNEGLVTEVGFPCRNGI